MWLDKQLGPPTILEPPVLEADLPAVRRRIVGKQKPGEAEESQPMDVEPKRETDVLSDPITTQMEDTCAM